ncbi:MAG: autotransporter-associated beta strand repeat-containing protein, partial [Luteolibacter sp.]
NGGDQTLTGVSNYTRSTTIGGGGTSGTLRINSVANNGSDSAIGRASSSNASIGIIKIGDGGATSTLVYTGTGHSTNRPIQIGVNSATPQVGDTGGAIIQADGASNAALTLSGNTAQTNAANGVGADRTLTLQGSSTGLNTFSGIIQNNVVSNTATGTARVSVTKAQAGTWVLSGVNTYTGSTSVNAGTLVINGNQSAANGAVSVTGKLTGSGTVGGATTINAAGVHNAGNPTVASGVGSQTFSSTLNYANSSIFEWDLNSNSTASGFDTVAATGITVGTTDTIFKVILGTTAAAGIADTGNAFWNTPSGTQTWTMASIFGAAFTSGAFQSVQTSTDVSAQGSFTITGTSLTWTAVPEPTSALAGILLGAGLLRRRRA